jgi:hypothetical protein
MKLALLRFLMSRRGVWLTPLIAVAVGSVTVAVARYNGDLGAMIDEKSVTAWLVEAIAIVILALANGASLKRAGDGIELAQVAKGLKPDRVAGPKFQAAFEEMIAESDPLEHVFGDPAKEQKGKPAKRAGWWRRR